MSPAALYEVSHRPSLFLYYSVNFAKFLQDNFYVVAFQVLHNHVPSPVTRGLPSLSCLAAHRIIEFPGINGQMKRHCLQNLVRYFLLAGAIVFVAAFTLSPVLHDHEADFADHATCPAHLIELALVTILISFSISFTLFLAPSEKRIPVHKAFYVQDRCIFSISRRGPPDR